MILTLEVSAPQGLKPGLVRCQQFGEAGGTIGRDAKSSWVLADSEVSSRHARITYRNRVFYIEDHNKSTNGIYLNSLDNRLDRSRPYELKSGDRIFIRPYEIHVSIADDTSPPATWPPKGSSHDADPFGIDDRFAPRESIPRPIADMDDSAGIDGPELNPLNLVPQQKAPPSRNPRAARDLEDGSLMDGYYRPSEIPPAPPVRAEEHAFSIPSDYDALVDRAVVPDPPSVEAVFPKRPPAAAFHDSGGITPPAPPKKPVARARKPPSERGQAIDDPSDAAAPPTLADVLSAAGLKGVTVTPELASDFGQILRVVVSGLIKVLYARQHIKEEFGVRLTHFGPSGQQPFEVFSER